MHDLSVPPGTYDITVALADEAGNRVGATDLRVEVLEEQSWQASDLLLAVRPGLYSPLSRPLLDGRVGSGEVVIAYVEVRGGEQPTLSGSLRGPDANAEPEHLQPVALARDHAGIHRGALQVRLDQPGTYLLQLALVDAARDESKAMETSFKVVTGR